MKLWHTLPLAFLLVGCADESPPHWDDVCVKSYTTFILIPQGKGGVIFVPNTICSERERMCVIGKDYRGLNKECPKEQ
jgi:hypothetical protein